MDYNFFMPTKLHVGCGKLEDVASIVKQYGCKCFLVTTQDAPPLEGLYNRVKSILEASSITCYHFDKVQPNPTTGLIESGIEAFKSFDGDVILAVGGGSSMDTAKSIALLHDEEKVAWDTIFETFSDPFGAYDSLSDRKIPFVAVPTTAGTGSEVTQAAVISMGQDKNTIFHPDNYANEAIVDSELLLTLPKRLTASTGFDAFTHAFESYINVKASPMSELFSMEAMKTIIEVLPKAVMNPKDIGYREKLIYAQTLAGAALANAGANAPHPLSEIIGGITHISHGESLALVFPEFIDVFEGQYGEKFEKVKTLFHENNIICDSLATCVKEFLKTIDLYKTAEDYELSKESYELIYGCPILGFLPFGQKEDLQLIIEKALKGR